MAYLNIDLNQIDRSVSAKIDEIDEKLYEVKSLISDLHRILQYTGIDVDVKADSEFSEHSHKE